MAHSSNGTTQKPPTVQQLQKKVQMLSELTARLSLGSKMGYSHQGKRDLYKTLGYPNDVTSPDMLSRWKRQDICRAIVDRPTKATWQGGFNITESTEEDETQLEKDYKQLDKRLAISNTFMRVDRLSLLGKYAVILLGFDDSSKETWGLPVTEGKRDLMYMRVMSEENAEIASWEKDTSSPRYGLPRIYRIKFTHPGEEEKTTSLQVHHSRIIHVTPDLLENEVEGHSYVETAFNRLMDIEKLVGGSAEMFWRGARPGYAGKTDPNYQIPDDLENTMKSQIEEYENDLRRFMMLEGVDLESLSQQIADPSSHFEVQLKALSALTRIPLRILLGSERGNLASSQDDNTWKEWLQARREEEAEPSIIRPFINRMIKYEIISDVKDDEVGYDVAWPDLFSLNEESKADIGQKRASAISSFAKEPMSQTLIPPEAFLKYVLRLDEQEVNHIMELQESQMKDLLEEENELETERQQASEES